MTEATAQSRTLEPVAPGEGWTRTRLCTVIALVAAAQAALIFVFGEKKEVLPRAVHNVPMLKIADITGEQLELLALENPTLFVLPNPKDFASAFWLTNIEPDQPSFSWTEPSRWLPMSADGLGAGFVRLIQTNFPARQPFSFRPVPELSVPTLPVETTPVMNSTMQIEGELAQRQMPSQISLTNWPYADVLGPCVVQVLVDTAGNVISTVLLKSSTYKDANDKALELARALRFTPAANLSFGRVTINWHTVPPAVSP